MNFEDFLNSKAGSRYNNSMYLKPDGTPRNSKFLQGKYNMFQNLISESKNLPSTVVGGQVVGKTRPTGIGRVWAGVQDFLTGYGDRDQLGDSGYKKNPLTGFGGYAEGYEAGAGGKPEIQTGYEAKNPLDIGAGTQKEGTTAEKEKSSFQDKLNQLEAMGERGANRNLIRSQIANFPALMAAGGMAKAEAFKGIAEQSSRWGEAIVNNPYYPAVQKWNPATPINYNLGRSSLK
jgi:hypothetical protein